MFDAMFDRMTIGRKIALGFGGALTVLILGVIAVGVVTTNARIASRRANIESATSFDLAMRAQKLRRDVVEVQQFLSDVSATRGLDGLNDGFAQADKYRQAFQEQIASFRQHYGLENDQSHLAKLAQIEARFAVYYETGKKMAQAYVDGGPEAGNKMMGEFDRVADELNESIQPFVEEQALAGAEQLKSIDSSLLRLQIGVVTGGAFAILCGVLSSFFISRSIVRTLTDTAENLREGAAQVATASEQIAGSSQILADGATEQAAALEETSSALEEMAAMTKQNADNAGHAKAIMQETTEVVADANASMHQLTTSMAEVARASEDISKIIKTIDEIAFQTNLLALNAAVEAARAGEAGAGFAVVADEVRNLAMRAAEAAKDTSALIESTVHRVQQSSAMLAETNRAFTGVSERSGKIGHLINEISTANQEQAQGVGQINNAVSEVDRVTQQNAAAAKESASAAEELSAQSELMLATVQDLAAMIGGRANPLRVSASRSAEPALLPA